jgi:phosphohistidine phosphatase SixA
MMIFEIEYFSLVLILRQTANLEGEGDLNNKVMMVRNKILKSPLCLYQNNVKKWIKKSEKDTNASPQIVSHLPRMGYRK